MLTIVYLSMASEHPLIIFLFLLTLTEVIRNGNRDWLDRYPDRFWRIGTAVGFGLLGGKFFGGVCVNQN